MKCSCAARSVSSSAYIQYTREANMPIRRCRGIHFELGKCEIQIACIWYISWAIHFNTYRFVKTSRCKRLQIICNCNCPQPGNGCRHRHNPCTRDSKQECLRSELFSSLERVCVHSKLFIFLCIYSVCVLFVCCSGRFLLNLIICS